MNPVFSVIELYAPANNGPTWVEAVTMEEVQRVVGPSFSISIPAHPNPWHLVDFRLPEDEEKLKAHVVLSVLSR